MTNAEPMRPDVVETVFLEPDQQEVLAVVPAALWLAPGDVVELDDPPRDARVLSSRLQLRADRTRVLVILDVPDSRDDALRGAMPTEEVLGVELDEPGADLGGELDRDLAALAPEPDGPAEERAARP
jgi:hypothetical protein